MLKTKYCRFCEVPSDKTNPKLNNLTSQLIQYHYIDEFYFYFAKPINEILGQTRSPEYSAFREIQVLGSKQKLKFSFYNKKDWADVICRKSQPKYKLPAPILSDHQLRDKLLKDCLKKEKLGRLVAEDEDERRRYQRRRQQLPLRDGIVLNDDKEGFVNPESFETKIFDIYEPEYSSFFEIKEPPMKSILIERLKKGAYPRGMVEFDQGESLKPKQKVQIPLLCLKKPIPHLLKESSNFSEGLTKTKLMSSLDPTKSRGLMGSENQSTQFSSTCIFNKNTRRKQVLEDSKRNTSRQRSNSKVPPKQFASSPKLARKKKNKDQSLKEPKKSRRSKDFEGKNAMATSNSLFNSKNWKVLKSWDQFMGGRFRDCSAGEGTLSRCDQITGRKDCTERKDKKAQVIVNENLKLSRGQLPVKAMGNISSRKAALSPRVSERPLTHREPTYKSFKEKCSFKNAKQRGYKKPLWIGVPDQRDKKSIRELLLKPDNIIGFRTQSSLNVKKGEFDRKNLPFEIGCADSFKIAKSRIHRDRDETSGCTSFQMRLGSKDRTRSEDMKEEKSQERLVTKASGSAIIKPLMKKKKGLSIKDWRKVAGESKGKGDLTSNNHFLTSRSCTRRGKEQAQIITERKFDRESKSKTRRGHDTKSHVMPATHIDC
jgi:hypothetical protein